MWARDPFHKFREALFCRPSRQRHQQLFQLREGRTNHMRRRFYLKSAPKGSTQQFLIMPLPSLAATSTYGSTWSDNVGERKTIFRNSTTRLRTIRRRRGNWHRSDKVICFALRQIDFFQTLKLSLQFKMNPKGATIHIQFPIRPIVKTFNVNCNRWQLPDGTACDQFRECHNTANSAGDPIKLTPHTPIPIIAATCMIVTKSQQNTWHFIDKRLVWSAQRSAPDVWNRNHAKCALHLPHERSPQIAKWCIKLVCCGVALANRQRPMQEWPLPKKFWAAVCWTPAYWAAVGVASRTNLQSLLK